MVAKEEAVDVIYLDSQRAFDKVSHKRRFRKLDKHWVRGTGCQSGVNCGLRDRGDEGTNGQLSAREGVNSGMSAINRRAAFSRILLTPFKMD